MKPADLDALARGYFKRAENAHSPSHELLMQLGAQLMIAARLEQLCQHMDRMADAQGWNRDRI